MKTLIAALAGLGLAACTSAPAAPGSPVAKADSAHPAVLELYQSQGCSSCPPANAVLNELAGRSDLLALSFAVTYWDRLGWKDRFAQPAFTARQWDYARAGGRPNVATPQLIVNGRAAVLGSRKGEIEQAIARTDRGHSGPEIAADARRIMVGAAPAKASATVWFVVYDPRTINVPIRAGENGGRTLPHRNIVKQLTVLGEWKGKSATFTPPAVSPGLARAVLVQAGKGGPIIAARKI